MAERSQEGAAAAGTIDLGGDLTVNRLGFGAMRITGDGIWGDPRDHDEAVAVLRRAVELGVNLIDTADSYGPEVSETVDRRGAVPVPGRRGDRHEGRARATGTRTVDAERPTGTPRARLRRQPASVCAWSRSPSTNSTALIRRSPSRTPSAPSSSSRTRARSATSGCPTSPRTSSAAPSSSPRSCRSRTATTSPTAAPSRWSTSANRNRSPSSRTPRSWASPTFRPSRDVAERHDATEHQVALAWLLARSPAMLPIPGTGSRSHLEDNVAAARLRAQRRRGRLAHGRARLTLLPVGSSHDPLSREVRRGHVSAPNSRISGVVPGTSGTSGDWPNHRMHEQVAVGEVVQGPPGQPEVPADVGHHLHRGGLRAGAPRRQEVPPPPESFEQFDGSGGAPARWRLALRAEPAEAQQPPLVMRPEPAHLGVIGEHAGEEQGKVAEAAIHAGTLILRDDGQQLPPAAPDRAR